MGQNGGTGIGRRCKLLQLNPASAFFSGAVAAAANEKLAAVIPEGKPFFILVCIHAVYIETVLLGIGA